MSIVGLAAKGKPISHNNDGGGKAALHNASIVFEAMEEGTEWQNYDFRGPTYNW